MAAVLGDDLDEPDQVELAGHRRREHEVGGVELAEHRPQLPKRPV
ncbi:hypothetical protein [Candidatus Skiveiella danica]